MTERTDTERAQYDNALAQLRSLAAGMGYLFGPANAASALEIVASELRISAHGSAEAARYLHQFADLIATTGKAPPSLN